MDRPIKSRVKILLITGMSGAGKTTALKTLEDLGYSSIDNIPISILPEMLKTQKESDAPLAIGLDVRNKDFTPETFKKNILQSLKGKNAKLVFLDCSTATLIKRYKETRRKPPLSKEKSLVDAIKHERKVLSSLLNYSDIILDTSDFLSQDLRKWIKGNFGSKELNGMSLNINSFSYKKGIPRDSDLVFDVRFLKNPHYEESLKKFNGKNQKVKNYISSDKNFNPFYNKLLEFIKFTLPRYKEEGKLLFTISIGCTGGKHRSVFISEKLKESLKIKWKNISIYHRDINEK